MLKTQVSVCQPTTVAGVAVISALAAPLASSSLSTIGTPALGEYTFAVRVLRLAANATGAVTTKAPANTSPPARRIFSALPLPPPAGAVSTALPSAPLKPRNTNAVASSNVASSVPATTGGATGTVL